GNEYAAIDLHMSSFLRWGSAPHPGSVAPGAPTPAPLLRRRAVRASDCRGIMAPWRSNGYRRRAERSHALPQLEPLDLSRSRFRQLLDELDSARGLVMGHAVLHECLAL